MRKSGNWFSARILLKTLGIDHVQDFGLTQSKIIVITHQRSAFPMQCDDQRE
jgi:hypothetical protein